jgi:hypothetical protein
LVATWDRHADNNYRRFGTADVLEQKTKKTKNRISNLL